MSQGDIIKAVYVWPFDEAPLELQKDISGGDCDFVIAAPPGVQIPYDMDKLTVSDHLEFVVQPDGSCHKILEADRIRILDYWVDPALFAGWTVRITCHA